jgi:hypothetical protein
MRKIGIHEIKRQARLTVCKLPIAFTKYLDSSKPFVYRRFLVK